MYDCGEAMYHMKPLSVMGKGDYIPILEYSSQVLLANCFK